MKLSVWAAIIAILAIIVAVYLYTAGSKGATPSTGSPSATSTVALEYYCNGGGTMQATFDNDEGTLSLALSDGRSLSLAQAVSGSGIRYEGTTTAGTAAEFTGKGDYGGLAEGSSTAYASCIAAHVAPSDAPGYDTYADQSGTFTFSFPTNFAVAAGDMGYTQGWAAFATTSGMTLAKITVPGSVQPGTNFGDATFSVGTSADPSAVALCGSNPSGSRGTATTTSLGGTPFTKLTFSDAAAGNRYDTTSYRVVRDGQCYAVEYTIHYGVLENYPKGSVKAFDEQGLAASLDEMAQSFAFTN
jgi:membrane-bound inhibitor of C-type lysozyme